MNRKAILVDDDIDFIAIMKNLFKNTEFEVIAFEDPLIAIEFFRSVSPNTFLLLY